MTSPDPMDLLLALPTEDGIPQSRRLDHWQHEDLEAALRGGQHQWWERPRGHSKTEDSAQVALVCLLVGRPGQRIYFAATDEDQAALALDSMRSTIRRAPVLAERLRVLRGEIAHEAADSTV